MSLNPLVLLEKAINEHGSATILKERLALAADQFQKLENENRELKKSNKSLHEKVDELTRQLEAKTVPEEYIKKRGVLFLRNPDGSIDPDAYCPTCKSSMFSLMGATPLKCKKCGEVAGITGNEIKGIIAIIQ